MPFEFIGDLSKKVLKISYSIIIASFHDAVDHVCSAFSTFVRRPGKDLTHNRKLKPKQLITFLVPFHQKWALEFLRHGALFPFRVCSPPTKKDECIKPIIVIKQPWKRILFKVVLFSNYIFKTSHLYYLTTPGFAIYYVQSPFFAI